jgi:hypothetical protein
VQCERHCWPTRFNPGVVFFDVERANVEGMKWLTGSKSSQSVSYGGKRRRYRRRQDIAFFPLHPGLLNHELDQHHHIMPNSVEDAKQTLVQRFRAWGGTTSINLFIISQFVGNPD